MPNIDEFFQAVERGDAERVAEFLDGHPELTNARHEGAAPLHYAALGGHREVVDLLLERGAELDAPDAEYNAPPIGWANEAGRQELVHHLYEAGAGVDLHRAAAYGLRGRVRELLERSDAEAVNAVNGYGTPIHYAALWARPAIVELLLQHGADPELRNRHGESALEIAQRQLESGGDSTPLVEASRLMEMVDRWEEIVRTLETQDEA